MANLSDILYMNQNGAALLGQGKTSVALRVFRVALGDLTGSLSQVDDQDSHDAHPWHAIAPVPLELPGLRDDEASPNNSFCLYTRAFISDQGMTDADEAAMILLYNFALAWQVRGLSQGKNVYLRKALNVYGLLDNMFQTRNVSGFGGPGWDLLKLALWTNVGHIHSHHVHSAEAGRSIDNLREILLHSYDLPTEDWLFFHQIIFHVDMQGFANLAPAA